jgi:MFS superfamily sulfate permease-like transporter
VNWVDGVARRLSQAPRAVDRSVIAAVRKLPEAWSSWRTDLPASIVVFLVALPLCLGIALASGAPLFSGVISGVVGGLLVGALSGSQLMVSGPAAGLTAIVVSAIGVLGSYQAFLAAVVVGGALQLVLGGVRAGVLGYYFPSSVIKGMLAAIGLILILKQVPHAVGYDTDFEGDQSFIQANHENTFSALMHALQSIEPGAVVISLVGLALLVTWDLTPLKRIRLLPAPLVVVLVGLLLNLVFKSTSSSWTLESSHLVALPTPETLGDFAAYFSFPDWSALKRLDTWRVAVSIGIVASLETLLSLEATDRLDPFKREAPPNRELFAQGVGNMAAGLIGGLPVTGVIVRSAANVDAGARTKLSAILHGFLLAGAAVSIPSLLNYIPLASLAAILLYTGYKLANPKLVAHMWRQGVTQALPFVITIVAILFTDLLVGIAIGLSMGLLFLLIEHSRQRCYEIVSPPGAVLMRVRLHEQVSFLSKASLASLLNNLEPGSRVELDASRSTHIHQDILEFIGDFRQTALLKNIELRLVGIQLPPPGPTH